MLIWLLAVLFIPVITVGILFINMAEDFWDLMTFRLNFSRMFGDLIHVLFLLLLGIGAELFALFELVRHLL